MDEKLKANDHSTMPEDPFGTVQFGRVIKMSLTATDLFPGFSISGVINNQHKQSVCEHFFTQQFKNMGKNEVPFNLGRRQKQVKPFFSDLRLKENGCKASENR